MNIHNVISNEIVLFLSIKFNRSITKNLQVNKITEDRWYEGTVKNKNSRNIFKYFKNIFIARNYIWDEINKVF